MTTDAEILEYCLKNPTATREMVRKEFRCGNNQASKILSIAKENLLNGERDPEIILENIRLAKQVQKQQDINRIKNKSFRENARLENALTVLAGEIKKELKEHAKELSKINIKPLQRSDKKGVGVIHITDTHGNELINLPHNKYDFDVLSKRMRLYINESCEYFKFMGVSRVLFVSGGDTLNSDRRLDEILNASTNRAKASILMLSIFKQAILDVRNRGYAVDIVSVQIGRASCRERVFI